MTTCLVTDRKRADVLEQAQRAVAAGVDLIQIRERDLEAAPLAELVMAVLSVARSSPGSSTRVVVNDRLDVALASGADGVHLRRDSIPTAAARRLAARPFVIGRSVHSAAEAASAGDVDYVIAGTVFATPSKPGAACIGLDGLRAIVRAAAAPVLAIGGIETARFGDIAQTGAAGVAAIGLFSSGPLSKIVIAARAAFDTAKARP